MCIKKKEYQSNLSSKYPKINSELGQTEGYKEAYSDLS